MRDYLDHLVSFVCRTSFNDLPQAVVVRAKEVLADTLSVIAAGARENEVKGLTERLVDPKDKQVASLIGPGIRPEPSKAALINGTAGTFWSWTKGTNSAGAIRAFTWSLRRSPSLKKGICPGRIC
jgi:2-methylcitrate dehydratase PrpD